MDVDVLLEALSALTGAEVKSNPEPDGLDIAELTVHNFVSSALLPLILCKDEPPRDADSDGPRELLVNMQTLFDPRYNYDFRNMKDGGACMRGDEPYTRPCGWFRFALRVTGKYPGGDDWLGSGGWRSESVPGEWPVSYHGTGRDGVQNPSAARQEQDYGIFSTPDIAMAEKNKEMYKEFKSKKDGKTYRVIMQNRINPGERIKKQDKIWLIKIPLEVYALEEDQRKVEMKKIVDSSIRPYGILLKEIEQSPD